MGQNQDHSPYKMTPKTRNRLCVGLRFKIILTLGLWVLIQLTPLVPPSFAETETQLHSNGKVHLAIEINANRLPHGWTREYDENGILRSEKYFENGVRHGPSRLYYNTGEVMTEWHYRNGKRHGPSLGYYKSGAKKDQGHYINDQLNGTVLQFYENGMTRASLNFKNDVQHGESKTFFPDGGVEHLYRHDNGRLVYSETYSGDGQLLQKQHFPLHRFR